MRVHPFLSSNDYVAIYIYIHHGIRKNANSYTQRSILRLATLLLLFDVYLTWSLTETFSPSPRLTSLPLLTQYLFFLSLTLLSMLAFHLPIRFLTTLPSSSSSPSSPSPHSQPSVLTSLRSLLPTAPSPNATSTALLVSSFTKLFPLLLLVWDYDARRSVQVAGWAVLASNVVAVGILCGCGWGRAGFVVGVGAAVRGVVEAGMLEAVGVERTGFEGMWGV